ncbi:MAG: 5-demethoxyubiquinol-8 5-hydroxylase UbiM [Hyphomonadaceae bacterium]|nr:5-demethoxyubiquinol-8 5-hydroxylase UbiM [Hyphomonadaceae bacterium]
MYDLIIVGAGPAGLSLAARLAQSPLRIALIEKQNETALADPAYDGREIALTQASIERLEELGAWQYLRADEAAPLRRADVLNGNSPFVLGFANRRGKDALGALVPNSAIRRTLYQTAKAHGDCDLFAGESATFVKRDAETNYVRLSDGRILAGKLLVGADTRFSPLRQSQGIGAHMTDFGRTMLVCRVRHERPHDGVAIEWFDHNQTIAMLPLNDSQSSFVLTLPADAMQQLGALNDADFAAEIENRTQKRWGALALTSARFLYPLVAVYAQRFVAPRFALIGDAAVGMHPVTAHGFNFGLASAFLLGREIAEAARKGADIADPQRLARFDRLHRRATLPLFTATNAIAKLYSDERPLARLARSAGLRLMQATPGARAVVEASLRG